MKRPQDLVELAGERIGFAKAVLGPVEIHGHSEMSPCWRPLLHALSRPHLLDRLPTTVCAGVAPSSDRAVTTELLNPERSDIGRDGHHGAWFLTGEGREPLWSHGV
jgi:hypothetical protein